MRNVYRHLMFVLIVVVAVGLTIFPPERKLKRDKDLAGGSTLVYQVDIRPTDPPDTISRVKDLIARRLDPNGVMGISLVVQGGNRIEITMPLPNEAMKRLKRDFEGALASLGDTSLSPEKIDRTMALPGEARAAEIERLAGGDPARRKAFEQAAAAYDAVTAESAKADAPLRQIAERKAVAERALEQAQAQGKDAAILKSLQDDLSRLGEEEMNASLPAAKATRAYEDARKNVLTTVLTASEVRRVLELSDIDPRYQTLTGTYESVASPRKKAIARLKESHPGAAAQLDTIVEKWNAYQRERSTLDDPADVRRLLKGAGVLDFRIAVTVADHHPQEQELRKRLREGGPLTVQSGDARWFKLNKVDTWFRSADDYARYEADPVGFFSNRGDGFVVDVFDGEPYMLLYDTPGMRLTQAEGNWSVASARRSTDQIGKPNIAFTMDALGAAKLGELTGGNVNKPMAILLDDQVYTAPNLNSRISTDGQITGVEPAEIDYIVRVLGAGSMAAKLSSEPVSESTVGPELGADNLQRGLKAGAIAFALVAAFMVVYYFGCGMIAVVVLVINAVMILGVMSLAHAAFSLPGIAGVVLTFGQAVDANVLIYERMREELGRGYDLRNAARLGFSRALSPIVDGNISNLIICAMLGFFGTQEVRGFAVTLSIGILTTLFCTLYITRILFVLLIDKFHWRKSSQLPIAVPFVQRLMHPNVDWMKHHWTHLGLLVVFLMGAGGVAWHQGSKLLGTEFRGGTAVTLTLKQSTDPGGRTSQLKLTREEVKSRVRQIAERAPIDSPLHGLSDAQIIAVNPEADNVTSSTFTVKTRLTDPQLVQSTIASAFGDVIESRPQLRFNAAEAAGGPGAPVFPIVDTVLGKSINRPSLNIPSGDVYGGTAVVVENIEPAQTLKELTDRVRRAREKSGSGAGGETTWHVIVLEGTDDAVKSVVVTSKEGSASYFDDPKVWEGGPREREWRLVRSALTESQTLASVQSFSPAIARTFAMQGAVCTALSLILLTLYVFIRFGTLRWAIAATVPLFADVIGIVGLLGLAQLLYENPGTHNFATAIGLLPFEVDLAQIAAILTIVGYSLNDKIIILDRIRESKGRSPYASRRVINDSINQTLSRTIITAGAHMITTIVLYCYGGEAVRGFAYTFNLGVLLGTYTSIVSTPLVWSRKTEALEAHASPQGLQPAT
ncbi:MAG: protein translocase subunit SecD [Phycisphaerales bacterium]|nr:protein translocase subunit SecD [Phycisphaerales bacterium]